MRTFLHCADRAVLFVITTIVITGLGCTKPAEPTANTSGTGAKTTAPGTKHRIVIISNGSSPFWDAVDRGLRDAGKELGIGVELIRNNATEGGQISRLEQVATQSDIKGVGVSVVEAQAEGVKEQMLALRKKGVHVIAIDSDGPEECREAFVGTNNLEAGRELGRATAQLRPDGGQAVCFVGLLGAQNARERIQGFKEGAGDKIKVVDSMEDGVDESKARRNVVAAMQNHRELNILTGIWSYNAPAIADELAAANRRSDFTVAVFDAEPNAIIAMEKGLIDVMLVQNPYGMGYQGVKLLHALVVEDEEGVKAILKDGKSHDTGLKLVVPDDSSPVSSPSRMTLQEFKDWLKQKELEGS